MSTIKAKYVSAPVNGATVEPLVVQTNNLDRVTVDSSGNVGIGTNSPSSRLHVSGVVTATGGVGGTPAFSAFQSSAQTLSSATITKLQFQTEEFDTNNCYDSATTYRFLPNVAGYYQVSGGFTIGSFRTGMSLSIYKNGTNAKKIATDNSANAAQLSGSALVYLNGSTDYVELYGLLTGGQGVSTGAENTYFQAFLARAA